MIDDLHRIVQLIEGEWKNEHVLVIGDVMLDRYIWGDVKRISPEAPVPVVLGDHRTNQAGGAANVAVNITGLGARCTLVGFIGADEDGQCLQQCLAKLGVNHQLVEVSSHPTASKLRILGGNQQILRLDVEKTDAFNEDAQRQILDRIVKTIGGADAVILSDYAKGVLTEHVCQRSLAWREVPGFQYW